MSTDQHKDGSEPRKLPLLALLTTSAVSTTGNYMTFVAIPWFVLQSTGSATKTGLAGGAAAFAAVAAGLLGGPLVDRLGFKRMSVVADLASGLTVALIPFLHLSVGLSFWQLLSLVFLGSLLDSPGVTAREALIPDLSRLARSPVERANAAYQAINRSSMLLGPVLAGVLLAALGANPVLLIDAVTFFASAAVIAAVVPSRSEPDRIEAGGSESGYVRELANGVRFLWRDRSVLWIVAVAIVANFLLDPLSSVVLPVYSSVTYDSSVDLGLMLAGFGGGALAGAVCFGFAGHRLPRRWTFLIALSVGGLPLWVLAATPGLAVTLAALIVMGLGVGPINPLLYTVLQERTPKDMLGRVLGAFTALAMASVPLGTVLMGFILEGIGLRITMLGISACYSALILAAAAAPELRKL